VAILGRVVGMLRGAWPKVRIEIRADADFAVPAVYEYCEKEGIGHTVGLISNPRFVVTSRTDEPEELYDWYVRRGEAENRIKDFERASRPARL